MSRSIFNTYKDFTNGTPDEPVNVKWFGAVGDGSVAADGSTPDQTAIEAAIAYCVAKNLTLGIPDGTYKHKTAINWAFNHLHVMALGDNVVFVHTGTGIAHNFSGILNYPNTQGCVGGVFGGPGRIMLKGNPAGGTTRGVNIDNWHFGYMKVAIHDAETAFYGNDTGIVHSSAVETTFDIRVTSQDGDWARQPGHGVEFIKPVACTFEKLIVEGVGAGGVTAVVLTGASNNLFRGGTIEGNLGGGITEDSTCNHNTYIQVANEQNGGTNDWILSGTANVLINCNGGGVNGCLFNSTSATLIGGAFYNAVINDNSLWSNSTEFHGTFANNGTHTTIINPIGGVATAVESAATILHSKTFDTANANTFKINGNTVNAVTGTGSTVALSASPRFTGQVEIGAGVAPDATLTVNSNTGSAVAPTYPMDVHLVAAAGSPTGGVLSDVYNGEALFSGRGALGGRAAKIAVGAGVPYIGFTGEAWNGSSYVYGASLEFITLNAQTGLDSSHWARLQLVPSGSTILIDVMKWGPGVAIGAGATDPGAGNLNLGGGALYNNGTAPTGTGAYVRATSPSFTGTTTVATLAPTTINAFTLGGTISGGGNQINNVIIGTSTPLAGTFTTFQANTSVGVVNTNPKTQLDINNNASSSPALVVSTSLARMQAADAAIGGMEWVSYGASVQNVLAGATAGGTSASPTGTPATRNIFNLRGYGYNGSAWAVGGLIVIRSGDSGVWSGSNQGTQVDFYTTPNGTTALALAGSFNPKGGLSIGSAAIDAGAGTALLTPQTFASLTAASSTIQGAMAAVTDSTTTTWGATITGGGANHVLAYCNGTNWTVFGK